MLPLDGIRVVDLSQFLPGPFCTKLLAEVGAEVLKIEPLHGEEGRRLPPLGKSASYFHLGVNRGKRSMALNLKHQKGTEVFLRLIQKFDVLVEGFRPGVMDRIGLGWKRLQEVNPELIYCAITGYGQEGPHRNRVGHDLNYLALSGILGLQAEKVNPFVLPVQLADVGAGALPAVIGILLALQLRRRTGRGHKIDISMLDGLISWLAPIEGSAEEPWIRRPILQGGLACYNTYRTSDGRYVTLACVESKFWEEFCRTVERENWIPLQWEGEPAQGELRRQLQTMFEQKPAAEWEKILSAREICFEAVLLPEEMETHPHVRHRGAVAREDHPTEGPLRRVLSPIRISECEQRKLSPAAVLGEHTDDTLRSLGYSSSEIAALRAEGVVA